MADQTQSSNKCWENGSIFKSVKVILEVSLAPHSGPPIIDISFAQDTFWTVFGYGEAALPMSFETLIADANDANDVASLTQAILSGSSCNTFITLRDAKGVDLACNVQVMTSRRSENRTSPSSTDLGGIVRNHFTTMTIRSASTVGNVRAINMLIDAAMIEPSDPCHSAERVATAVTERIDQNTVSFQAQGAAKKARKINITDAGASAPPIV